MIDALHIAASGLRGEQKHIDVISNNVANMQTPGFKRSRVNFVEVAAPDAGSGVTMGSEASVGNGIRIASTSTQFSTGELRMTRGLYDVAIEGRGFFELETADGALAYSRDGQFRVDADGELVSVHGLKLSRSVRIPSDAIEVRIASNGEVSALLPGESARSVLGEIELVVFPAEDALIATGENLFTATEAAGAPVYGRPQDPGIGALRQGFVEMANVDMVDEMTSLVLAQRAYQLNARVLQAADQILETINNLRR
ncbi:MAG: flagellar hook-basal body complex protein [Lysobacteraceae bacterium]|nr:MAG: flagellar hook-basal body complex protein [Xanthomonadaceae bacterium]